MKWQPPYEPGATPGATGIHNSDPNAQYSNGNPATGEQGSIPPMEAVAHTMQEIVHLIAAAGLTPDHADLEQLRKGVLWMIQNLVPVAKSGDGIDLYHGHGGAADLQYYLRSLVAGDNVTLDLLTDVNGKTSIKINSSGSGGGVSGEANTGSNLGTGAKVFAQKSGVDFQHRSIKAGDGITVTEGTNEITVAADVSALPTLASVAPAFMAQQKRLPSTSPTVLINAAWLKRPLNDLIINQIAGAAFDTNTAQITLPAGTYRAQFLGVASNAGHHRTRLYDLTHATQLGVGNSADSYTGSSSPLNPSMGICHFVLAEEAVLEVQTYFKGSNTARMGDSEENGPDYHIDGWVEIVKEA